MPDFQDRVLKCVECSAEFVFTAGEQQFYHDKEFKNEPKRCKNCKSKRAPAASSDRGSAFERGRPAGNTFAKVETTAVCSQCGKETTVPFKPTQGRPVFCRTCFQAQRATAAAG